MKLLLMRPQSRIRKIIPMGIMYIAGYLRKYMPEVETEIIDLRQGDLSNQEITELIKKSAPDIVGISAVSMEAKVTHKLIECVKEADKSIKAIIGGPYATSLSHLALKDNNVLCCIIGEGEETARELLSQISVHADSDIFSVLSSVRGIAWSRNGEYVKNSAREYIADLNSIPMPVYDLINLMEYFRSFGTHSGLQAHSEYSSIFTSRGCPYNCIYCHDIFGKKIRYHSAERVIDEIQLLCTMYGVKEIHIEDDSFNLNRDRVKAIFSTIIEKGFDLKIAFPNGIRADHVDDEILNLFKKAGVYRLAYGIETGSLRVQEQIKKRLNLDVAKEAIELTTQKGISTHGFFMFGFLGETREDMLKTVDFALRSGLHTASFSFVIPQMGTQLYHTAIEAGYNFDNIDTDQLNPGDTEINISAVSTEELHRMRRMAYKQFYLNPMRIIKLYLTTPRKLILFRSFLVFLTNVLPLSIALRERLQGILFK